jgi:peptidoglycan/xylan/chitin deacetylase (PgdA/CDA1 family)
MDDISAAAGVPDPADNGVMSWEELSRLHEEGVTLAPHTRSHPMLNRLSADAARDEINQSWIDLVERFGSKVPRVIAYPAGGVNSDVVEVTRNIGFELGFGTERGVNRPATMDRYRVRRINVGGRTTTGLLRAQLAVSAD